MIERLFKHPHVLYQKTNLEAMMLPEPAIAASVCSDNLIILSQEGRELIINLESVDELCRLLKHLKKHAS